MNIISRIKKNNAIILSIMIFLTLSFGFFITYQNYHESNLLKSFQDTFNHKTSVTFEATKHYNVHSFFKTNPNYNASKAIAIDSESYVLKFNYPQFIDFINEDAEKILNDEISNSYENLVNAQNTNNPQGGPRYFCTPKKLGDCYY